MRRLRPRHAALIALLLLAASGCQRAALSPLPLGLGTFGLGAAFGFLLRDVLAANPPIERQCFRNGEPIDCSLLPSDG